MIIFSPNLPAGSMILMMVVDTELIEDMPSKQFTTVPFRPLLTELTTVLDISGRTFGPESLEKVIMEPLIIRGVDEPLVPTDKIGTVVWVIFSGRIVNSHR